MVQCRSVRLHTTIYLLSPEIVVIRSGSRSNWTSTALGSTGRAGNDLNGF